MTLYLFFFPIHVFNEAIHFLVACTRLYKPLCQSLCLSVAEGLEHATYGDRPYFFAGKLFYKQAQAQLKKVRAFNKKGVYSIARDKIHKILYGYESFVFICSVDFFHAT